MDEIDSIVLHSEGFDGVDGWCIRKSGAFEIFQGGKCRVRSGEKPIDPRFLIINKDEMRLSISDCDQGARPFSIRIKDGVAAGLCLSQAEIEDATIKYARIASGQGVSTVNNITVSAPSACPVSLRTSVIAMLLKGHPMTADDTISEAKKLVEFIEGDKTCQE